MRQASRPRRWLSAACLCLLAWLLAGESARAQAPANAEQVFAAARASLLQIRTLVAEGGRQSSIGSGFLVSADGLAITNYHVVSQFALEPASYRLQYRDADGGEGELQLLAIDVASDLAVVRRAGSGLPFLEFDPAAMAGGIAKGERLFSIGNPLDLGFTIVEGNHNGLVEKSYVERVHFSGAINPGMSGGPTLTGSGRVAGVNVAKLLSGELVSFLVPARFAHALLQRARDSAPMSLDAVRSEITAQLQAWQEGLYAQLAAETGATAVAFGPYRVHESELPWFSCWASTNADERPRPKSRLQSTECTMQNGVFVAGDLDTGLLQLSYTYARTEQLNAWQFAALLSRMYAPANQRFLDGERLTAPDCHDAFVQADAQAQPPLRALFCAQAYKEFAGLYDVEVAAVTQDASNHALVAKLSMRGVSYPNALAQARRFLEDIRWNR